MTYRVYNSNYRGPCPMEGAEQITFFARLRRDYPETYGRLGFHVRNEGKKTAQAVQMEKAEGMVTGASDIIIPGSPAFVCELKRRDSTKSRPSMEQKEYLEIAAGHGCFACVAYGVDEAWKAFHDWIN